MKNLDDNFQMVVSLEPSAVSEAALIWARATALRDELPAPATGEEKMPGIKRRLDIEGSKLLIARRDETCVAFTLFAPRKECLEIFYLAVDPDSWGSGVASSLLFGAEDYARGICRAALELWVIDDNERALNVYARFGFVDTEEAKVDESSGRIERRLVKQI